MFKILIASIAVISLSLIGSPTKAAISAQSDVCVYGGTSGGVIAAVQAARLGKHVILIANGLHLGGMTSGGLGSTDVGNSAAIGGTALEFYKRVGAYYSLGATFLFEPHIAEQAFNDMIGQANVTVYYQEQLASVTKVGTSITQITMANGDTFQASMFIDASYEGDLMAQAGVSFTSGRESNATYGETINGVHTPGTGGHQFLVSVDPYVTPGNPASGLLPLMQSGTPGTPGTADSLIQSYNYRLCMTQASNRVAVTAPAGYSASNYTLLARYIQARIAGGYTPQITDFFLTSYLQNGKYDFNNDGAISTDCIGLNTGYITANTATRALIAQAHINYIQGLMYFLGNDPSVPSTLQTQMKSYGFAPDEFTDNGNWPWQLYVRESRRMLSDYVMTQANCSGTVSVNDPIGLGSYTMDSHNAERVVVNGTAQNEGDVEATVSQPYSIPYRAIIPKASQCTNLFVPWSLSASHAAFASVRMEPVFMILGQAAGTAASLAIDNLTTVQNVNQSALQQQLRSDGQILYWDEDPASMVVTLDNASPTGVTLTGPWSASTAVAGYYDVNYLNDGNTNKGASSVAFTPTIKTAGNYQVYMRWSAYSNRDTNVPVDVNSSTGTTTQYINEQLQGGQWVSLGVYSFSAGTTGSVVVRNGGTTGYVVADAVRFVRRPTAYGGTAWPLPGTVQASNYDVGSQGIAYYDTTLGNYGAIDRTDDVDVETTMDVGGGYDIGWIEPGEWLGYTVNVTTAGTYNLDARVSSGVSGGSFHVEFGPIGQVGGAVTSSPEFTVPATGSYQTWTTITEPITLTAGPQWMRVVMDTAGYNLNWCKVR